jgi:hypothetical protein
MNQQKALASTRLALGIITLGAVLVQLIDSITKGRSVSNFFSFFTIESNILAAVLLIIIGSYILMDKQGKTVAYLRGALTLFMTMTGIIYILLLAGYEKDLQTTIPIINIILHYVIPGAVLLDWLVYPPKRRLSFSWALLWLSYPLLYLTYSLIRGAIVNWYPYPFINPVTHGWPNVIGASLTIALAATLLVWLLVWRTTAGHRSQAA